MAPVGAVICGIILAERWAGPWKGQLSHLAETGEPIGQGSYEDNARFVTTLQLRLPPGSTARNEFQGKNHYQLITST